MRGRNGIRSVRWIVISLLVILIFTVSVPSEANAEIKNRWWVHTSVGRKGWRSISDGGMDYDGKSYKFGYNVLKDKGRWRHNSKGWWYEWSDGTFPTHTIIKIDGEYYYFKDDGYMAQNGYWYGVYYSRSGAMQFGKGCVNAYLYWDDQGRRWFGSYIPDENGKDQLVWWKRNGWVQNHGSWYYFVNGYAVLGRPLSIKGKCYWFNKYGVCINP